MGDYDYENKEVLLKVRDVSQRFGDKLILRDVDLEIVDIIRPGMQQGQVVALLAPSGVGKTTLFRILAGLDRPLKGSVLVTDKAVPVKAGMVGVVAQHYPLFEHRTVLGNMLVAGRKARAKDGKRLTKADRRTKAMETLESLGIEAQAGSYPATLSGGQRQRAAIAQQLMCSSHFLLMDEPFSGLDIISKEAACEAIRRVSTMDELNTLIVVSHDIPTTLEIADLVWIMGYERDAEGKFVPGARIVKTIDLKERGLAWRPHIKDLPAFHETVREIEKLFPTLKP